MNRDFIWNFTVCMYVCIQWRSNREEVVQQGTRVIDVLSKATPTAPEGEAAQLPGTGCIQRAYQMLEKRFDNELGGFGRAPKFPQPSRYMYLCTINYFLKYGPGIYYLYIFWHQVLN